MRVLWAKWTNIPRIIIPKLDSAWGMAQRVRCWTNSTAEMFIQLKDILYSVLKCFWTWWNQPLMHLFHQSNSGYFCVCVSATKAAKKCSPLTLFFSPPPPHAWEKLGPFSSHNGPYLIRSASLNIHHSIVQSEWVGLKDFSVSKFFRFACGGSGAYTSKHIAE